MSKLNIDNFPVGRDPTTIEVTYIEDVYRMGNYADIAFCFFLFPALSAISVIYPLFLGGNFFEFLIPLILVPISIGMMIDRYIKLKEKKYTGEPLREVRGTITVRRKGAGFFPYLHDRLVRVPDQWRDELGELQQPVHALIYPLDEGEEWAALGRTVKEHYDFEAM